MGLTGEPVPPGSRSGAITHRNDQRPAASQSRHQVIELQVVEQVHAHRVDREHVHGKRDVLDDAGRGVAVAVAAEHGHLPLGQELHGQRVQPRAAGGHVPWAELAAPQPVPDPDEEQVTGADVHLLRRLRRGELVCGDVIARLEPLDAPQPRDVEQHATADDAVVRVVDGQLAGALRGDRARRDAVVQRPVVADVAQRVDVAVHVAVDVHRQLVRGERHSRYLRMLAWQALHVPRTRFGVVRAAAGQRGGEGHRLATLNLAGRGGPPVRRDEVQRAAAVIGPPLRRTAQPLVQRVEAGSGQISHQNAPRHAPNRQGEQKHSALPGCHVRPWCLTPSLP